MEGFNNTDSDSEDEDEDAILDGEETTTSLPPEASITTNINTNTPAATHPTIPSSVLNPEQAASEEDDDFAIEDAPLLSRQHSRVSRANSRISRTNSKSTAARSISRDRDIGQMRRLSNPLGMGEPVGKGGRRLSNALGQTFSGLATGGNST